METIPHITDLKDLRQIQNKYFDKKIILCTVDDYAHYLTTLHSIKDRIDIEDNFILVSIDENNLSNKEESISYPVKLKNSLIENQISFKPINCYSPEYNQLIKNRFNDKSKIRNKLRAKNKIAKISRKKNR